MTHTNEIGYAFNKLESRIRNCDPTVPEWVMVATRNNEKALCNKEITEDKYMSNQQHISDFVAEFDRKCRCKEFYTYH